MKLSAWFQGCGSSRMLGLFVQALDVFCAGSRSMQPWSAAPSNAAGTYRVVPPCSKAARLLTLLQHFLEDPTKATMAMPLAEKRRKHVHQALDRQAPGLVSRAAESARPASSLLCLRSPVLRQAAGPLLCGCSAAHCQVQAVCRCTASPPPLCAQVSPVTPMPAILSLQVTHVTQRTGRPYSLILTKTRAQWEKNKVEGQRLQGRASELEQLLPAAGAGPAAIMAVPAVAAAGAVLVDLT